MKKMLKLLAVAAMIACGLMMTSCTEEEIDAIMGPTDTWCKDEITYGDNVKLNVWYYYSTKEVPADTNNCAETLPEGLSILITNASGSDSVFGSLTKNSYALKSYPANSSVDVEGEKITGNRAYWTLIYRARASKIIDKSTSIPAPLNKDAQWSNVTETLTDFSWKKLLKTYLVSTL